MGDRWNSKSYWKAAVSILVNMFVFSPQTFHSWDLDVFLFNELLSLHISSKVVV